MLTSTGNSRKGVRCFLWRKADVGGFATWPISTYFSQISSRIRRRYAASRIGAITTKILKSRYIELYAVLLVSLGTLALWGSAAKGQGSLFSTGINSYIEEKAQDLALATHMTQGSLADISSMYSIANEGGNGIEPQPSLDGTTVQDSAMVAPNTPNSGYLDTISSQRSGVIEYTVQEGDLLSFIASDYGVSVDSLMWANNIRDPDSISPGQILKIPPVSGVIYLAKNGDTVSSIAKKYSADADTIIAYNRLPQDGAITAGTQIIIPGGKITGTANTATSASAIQPGQAITLSQVALDTPNIPYYGTASAKTLVKYEDVFSHLPNMDDYFKIPAAGYDWGLIHGRNGVDIANSCGTPVYAAADGTVTVSDAVGYNGGFGKYIKISHPNGTETLYAHGSKLLVQAGQAVAQGDKIMLIGATGYATGCHLHFEVHGAHNPLAKD